ncbi:hypothetical protein [Lacticaseibacillus thailandensis]|uniref:Uncharacterized protein n=2 Tax=Lacticaseibacillus thailandensis TaxID=381741 RepID=A0A0R2CHJ8_9LACO|nr:hypothetical protein [Lacticaseibacillus thailandensis]KRM87883.1 hypothetical protein FD19_GL000160 [Lacticaseibacillus thailandensis DSM 22698 = JCM 13996]
MVTVNSLIKPLINQNLVTAKNMVQREVGRPATKYFFNYDAERYLLCTIQEELNPQLGHNDLVIKPHVVNMAGTILSTGVTTDFSDYTRSTPADALRQALQLDPTVVAVGLAFPGKIDHGVVQSS